MRKIMLAMLLMVVLAVPAFAAVTTATFGDQNSSGTYRLVADSDGVLTMSSEAQLVGGSYKNMVITMGSTVVLSSNATISSGTTFILSGANIAKNSIFVPLISGSYTLDTGSNLSTASPGLVVGETIPFTVVNNTAGTVTMVGNTGMALGGNWTVATLQSRQFLANYVTTNSFTIY